MAGWKRGSEGSLRAAAVPDECWRVFASDGRVLRPDEGIDCILAESGDPVDGMRVASGRGDMW